MKISGCGQTDQRFPNVLKRDQKGALGRNWLRSDHGHFHHIFHKTL